MISVEFTTDHFHSLGNLRFPRRTLEVVHSFEVLEILGDAACIRVIHIDTIARV